MKKSVVLFALIIAVLVAAPASAVQIWEGSGSGSGETWTNTDLTVGKFWNKKGTSGSFMSVTQAGDANLSLKGKEKVVDKVKFTGKVKYDTGYYGKQNIPGGVLETYGNQSTTIKGIIQSGGRGH